MIAIMGDTHGSYDINKYALMQYKVKNQGLKVDYVIIAGDFGFIWNEYDGGIDDDDMLNMQYWFGDAPWATFFVPGNHENYDILDELPRVKVKGAICAEVIKDKLYMVDRGEILDLDGVTFLCIGGAASVDRMYRTEGVSWWPQEVITEADIDNALNNLVQHHNKVDYVITHTAPTTPASLCLPNKSLYYKEYDEKKLDPSCAFLDSIQDRFEWKTWFFGHFHTDQKISNKFVPMYDEVHYVPTSKGD